MSIERGRAAALAERGLAAVVGEDIVATLREDSPLEGIGLTEADLVCVSDAIAAAASARSVDCVLSDEDVVGLVTVADLVTAIATRSEAPA